MPEQLPATAARRPAWKRGLKFALGLGVAGFVGLNGLAYLHARAMTHYAPGGVRTQRPEALTLLQKIKVLTVGVRLPRPANDKTPADFGLPSETVTFTGAHGLRLEAWLIKQPASRGTVLLFHGYGSSKSALLLAAQDFTRMGYDALLVDHFGSGGSAGNTTSIGYHEADDVAAAFRFVREREPGRPVVLYGVSMGAVAILRAVAAHGIAPEAVVLECPFDRLLTTAQNRFAAMGLPAFPAAPLLVFWGGVQGGFDGLGFIPAESARQVRCPVLVMHGERDPRVTLPQMEQLVQNLNPSRQFKVFPGLAHQSYIAAAPDAWHGSVQDFLTGAMTAKN